MWRARTSAIARATRTRRDSRRRRAPSAPSASGNGPRQRKGENDERTHRGRARLWGMSRRAGVFKRDGWWWIDYRDADGKRHREKAAPTCQVAKLVYRDKMARIARGEVLGIREEGLRVSDFVEKRYWPAVAGTLAAPWAERTRAILDRVLLPRFGDATLAGVRREAIETWYAERLGQVSATTANKELARLKHLLGRAETWGYLRANPARPIKRTREQPGRTRYLSETEYTRLFQGADVTVTASDGRTWTIRRTPNPALARYMLFALHTGARRSELRRLRWADVDLRARTLTFHHTKNGHTRAVPMTDTLRAALVAFPRPLSPEAPVLPEREPKVISRAFARLVADL